MTARSPFSSGFTDDAADDLAHQLVALAQPHRLRILALLAHRGEMNVVDFVLPLGLAQPTVSHHLKVLTHAGLITKTQRGVFVVCKLDTRALGNLSALLDPKQIALPRPWPEIVKDDSAWVHDGGAS